MIFLVPKDFGYITKLMYSAGLYIKLDLFDKTVQNHNSGKIVFLPLCSNYFVCIYGHDPRAKFIVYTLAKWTEKYFIKLKIKPNPN